MSLMQRFYRMYGRLPYRYGAKCPLYTSCSESSIRLDLPEVWEWPGTVGREVQLRIKSWNHSIQSRLPTMIPEFITKLVMPARNKNHVSFNDDFYPTPELRYKIGGLEEEGAWVTKKLQQKWINPTTDDVQWRDVPTV